MKIDSKLTLHHRGDIFLLLNLPRQNFEIWRVTFLKVFYHKETMGLTSGFSEITETSSAHLDEMNFLFFFFFCKTSSFY